MNDLEKLLLVDEYVVGRGFLLDRVDADPFFLQVAVFVESVRIASDHRLLDAVFESAAAVEAELVVMQMFSYLVDDVLTEIEVLRLDVFHQLLVVKTAVLVGLLEVVGPIVAIQVGTPI